MHVLKSQEDKSINIIMNGFEARFVQREDDYFIIYVSSQKGCAQHCRMCHLTATGQTSEVSASRNDFIHQVKAVLKVASENGTDLKKIKKVHVNFMARGEPMKNSAVVYDWDILSLSLAVEIRAFFGEGRDDVEIRFIISTIFPAVIDNGIFYLRAIMKFASSEHPPSIYYSLYTIDPEIRKKWLPRAQSVEKSLEALSVYGNLLKMRDLPVRNKIHHAIIKGVNDESDGYLFDLMDLLHNPEYPSLRHIPINIVRYNPYDERYGEEASEEKINDIAEEYRGHGHPTKIIPRVGRDVFASCGTFYNPD